MKQYKEEFYLVREEVLPQALIKTIEAKKMLQLKKVKTVQEAVDAVGLSRSAFYKYKDSIFPFHAVQEERMITVSLVLEHRAGILSKVLSTIAQYNGNLLTINQSIPLQGLANVILTINTLQMNLEVKKFLEELRMLDGVQNVAVIGKG